MSCPRSPGARSSICATRSGAGTLFATSGLTIRRVSPRVLRLQTDRLETLGVPVEVDLEGLETAGPVTIEPRRGRRPPAGVARRGARSRRDREDPPSRLAALRPGRRTEINQVPIELAGCPTARGGSV
jgi:hypothetical protein